MKHRPLFIIGNKRSGTSLLVKILLTSPEIYCSFESDAAWILYCLYHKKSITPYKYDNDVGLNITLDSCAEVIDEIRRTGIKSVEDAFYKIQLCLKSKTGWAKHRNLDIIKYIGDKKPVQYADPDVFQFITTHFKDPCFLHIVRDPRAAAGSMMRKAQMGRMPGIPEFWREGTDSVLSHWVKFEKWVIDAKRDHQIYTIRFEDLCKNYRGECADLFNHLGLKVRIDKIPSTMCRNTNFKYQFEYIRLEGEAREIAREYRYVTS